MKITIIEFLWGFHLALVIVNKGVESAKSDNVLMVNLTLVQGAEAKGAVCLDGSLPGYHLHRGHGTGANSWLILLQGGGWCANIQACVNRKITSLGSSKFMEKQLPFMGILSDKAEENPDFFNWNRVKFRYCDGASFSGEGQDEAANLMFRGQRIWIAGIEDLLSSGMREADQAFLSGCSAGGVATIIHCDEFRSLFPERTKVKCLSDAGLFLDVADVSGRRVLKYLFHDVVSMQGVGKNLPKACLEHMGTTSCFFPQYLVDNIRTPLFLVNSAYDTWQIHLSLVPPFSDRNGDWNACKLNQTNCSPSQMQFLQDFKRQMLDSVESFSMQRKNGLFIDSWFAHCQTEAQETWFSKQAPLIGGKGIAQTVGDWYFDRSMQVKETYRSNESNSSTKPTVTSNWAV